MFSPRSSIYRYSWILVPLLLSLTYFWEIGENSFWYDELQTWYSISLVKFSYFWSSYRLRETAPPLYYVLNYWIHQLTSVSETSLRMISAVSMAACNVLLFAWARRWLGWIVALMAVLLLTTNGYMIGFAQLARSYGLFTLTSTAAFLFALKIVIFEYDKKSALALFACLIAGLLTHYYGVVVFGAISLWMLAFSSNKKELLRKFAATMAIPFAIFLYLAFTQRLVTYLDFLRVPDLNSLLDLGEFLFNDPAQIAVLNFGLIFLLVRLFTRRPHRWDRILGHILIYNLLVFALVSLICLVKPVYALRYITFLAPTHVLFLSLLVVAALEDLFVFLKKSSHRLLAVKVGAMGITILFAGSQLWLREIDPDRYTPVAHYPLRQALEATIAFHRNSSHASEEIEFIVEEFSHESVRLYFPKMGLDDIGILFPNDSIAKKRADFASVLPIADATIVYLVKVFHPERNQDYNEIQIPGWRAIQVFSQGRLSVYGFEKMKDTLNN